MGALFGSCACLVIDGAGAERLRLAALKTVSSVKGARWPSSSSCSTSDPPLLCGFLEPKSIFNDSRCAESIRGVTLTFDGI